MPEPTVVVIVFWLMVIPESTPDSEITFDKVLFEMFTLVGGDAVAPLTEIPCPTVVSVAVLFVAVNVFG